jgi:uncharacterized protein (TIGR03067 family)
MLLTKLKLASAALLVVVALGGCTGVFAYRTLASGPEGPSREQRPKEAAQTSDKKSERTKSDKEMLQGSWVPIASEVNGGKIDPDDPKLQQWKLVFDGDMVTLYSDEKPVAYTLDPKKQPKEMDIMVKGDKGPKKAVYELAGDRLKLSFRKVGERPSDFDTRKKGSVLVVFERRKTS